MKQLSIIIVNYNVRYFLEQALRSVEKAITNIDAEVFVVDNASADRSVEMVEEKFSWVKVIANKDNTGFSVANNQAIRQSTGKYTLLLNPDTVVEEDTFEKCIAFMEANPDAGGLGVKMIDGTGKFLPESKRALPTPSVAFFKAFGLSSIFPKSKVFAKYHLGYLDENENHEVEILAGAFMLMRKDVLDEIGLLDETFFMYGEDIDLSYRITKAGYKNYYLADTRIIHYKGESTKKGSLNYVKVFYEAMLIFAKKHFSTSQVRVYSVAIYLAIFVKGLLTILSNVFRAILLPSLDALLAFTGIFFIKNFWAFKIKAAADYYPPEFTFLVIPAYILIWILVNYFGGSYDKPYRTRKIFRATLIGTLIIAAVYGFLPENLRFSRAIILMGAAWTTLAMLSNRFLYHLVAHKKAVFELETVKNVAIVGKKEEANRTLSILKQTSDTAHFVGHISYEEEINENDFIGEFSQLEDIISLYDLDEIIFCAKDIPTKEVIAKMTQLGNQYSYKIVPPESMSIIGSDSKNTAGDLYAIDVHLKIGERRSRQVKRLFDMLLALLFIPLFPLLFFFVKDKLGFIKNIFTVLIGKKTWVGYTTNKTDKEQYNLPAIKKAVINPLSIVKNKSLAGNRLNLIYAKNYSPELDFIYILKGLSHLGDDA
ncbi:MAG: glycosyltransferase family 2 protein [Chitinophagales bacterium]